MDGMDKFWQETCDRLASRFEPTLYWSIMVKPQLDEFIQKAPFLRPEYVGPVKWLHIDLGCLNSFAVASNYRPWKEICRGLQEFPGKSLPKRLYDSAVEVATRTDKQPTIVASDGWAWIPPTFAGYQEGCICK